MSDHNMLPDDPIQANKQTDNSNAGISSTNTDEDSPGQSAERGTLDMQRQPESLEDIIEEVREQVKKSEAENASAPKLEVMRILTSMNRSRRSSAANETVTDTFKEAGLELNPAIGQADYYGYVKVRSIKPPETSPQQLETTKEHSASSGNKAESRKSTAWPISKLKDDDAKELVYLTFDQSLEDGIQALRDHRLSKIPVFYSESIRQPIGTLTTKLALANLSNEDRTKTRLYDIDLIRVPIMSTDTTIFEGIEQILKDGFIYGKDRHNSVVQIYTIGDVALYLHNIANVFTRVNELEELLKDALHSKDEGQLEAAKREGEDVFKRILNKFSKPKQSKDDSSNYTIADYIKIVASDKIWDGLFHEIFPSKDDKERCLISLNAAREARNDVMHFNSLSDDANQLIQKIEAASIWLRQVGSASS